ncbi:MAG: DUF1273 family protein [Clostridia bacterium]|nr:DUF1273 family protein [Clostridia bacterium]
MKRCYFAGHSKIYDKLLEKRLEESIIKLISEGIGEFVVSNYGAFDGLAASVVRKLKVNYPEIRLILVLPYLTKWVNENKELFYDKFDEIMLPEIPVNTPPRIKIIKMNEYMVKSSDALVCFVNQTFGGAYKTFKYAEKTAMEIINLAEI